MPITAEPRLNASITKYGIHFIKGQPRYISEDLARRLMKSERDQERFKINFFAPEPDEEVPVADIDEGGLDTAAHALAESQSRASIGEILGTLDPDTDYNEDGSPKLSAVQERLPDVTQDQLDAALRVKQPTATPTDAELRAQIEQQQRIEAKKRPTITRKPAEAEDGHEV